MVKFRKRNQNKFYQYKSCSARAQDKDKYIPLPNFIEATDINDNVISDNNQNFPWPKYTICITGNSVFSDLQPDLFSQKCKIKVKRIFGANVRDMRNNITSFL